MKQEFYIKKYTSNDKSRWNAFVESCMQQHFFFQRSFMEYHKDRFEDYSLIIEDQKGKVVALFPASVKQLQISSHGGLTFGGLLYKKRTFVQKIIDIILAIEKYYKENNIVSISYKVIPYIYKSEQGEEDVYALFKNQWKLVRRDFSTVIKKENSIISGAKKRNIKVAHQNGIEIKEAKDLECFYALLKKNLNTKYKLDPTHSLEELLLLKERFPKQFKLFAGFKDGIMLGGVLLFLTPHVCKIQYSVNSPEGKNFKVLDAVLSELVRTNTYKYIDFGHSSENDGQYLNEGLARFKMEFNGEALVCDFYQKDLTSDL